MHSCCFVRCLGCHPSAIHLPTSTASSLSLTPPPAVVNALSRELEVSVWRGGRRYQQRFSRGVAQSSLDDGPAPEGEQQRRGTQVRYLYDETIFSKT